MKLSNAEIIVTLGERFKQYRLTMRLTQSELAEQSGVNIVTIRRFENGQLTNLSLQSLLAMLRAIDQLDNVEQLLPELPINPMLLYQQKKQPQRVKHSRK